MPESLILRGATSRKAAFLFVIGLLCFVLGVAYSLPVLDSSTTEVPYAAAVALTDWWWPRGPLQPWGAAFAIVGALVITGAVRGRHDPHGGHKGFLLAEGMIAAWGALAFCSTLFFESPRGWITGLIFSVFAFSLHLVDGMGGDRL